jgi:hypothetical protein
MLTIWDRKRYAHCDGISRRDFLKVGALGVGGLTLADLLRFKAAGAVNPKSGHKAVIMFYLPGGPSHIDTPRLGAGAAPGVRRHPLGDD